MKKLNFSVGALALLITACGPGEKPLSERDLALARIDSMETILFADEEAEADPSAGIQLVREYARFYQNNEKDSLAVDMLFKAGEVSMGIGQGNLAVKYFRTVANDHTDFHKSPEALFLCGFCEETLNKDTAQARFFYESFVKKFPEHKLAEDAQFSIQNMSMSDEELIRMFQEKLKQEQ